MADPADERTKDLIRSYAEEFDCELWRSDQALYLVPTMGVFAPAQPKLSVPLA